MKVIENDNYIIKCGQNQNENDQIIRSSDDDSLWFHLDKMPSPHVVMEKKDTDYEWTKGDYNLAASICKMNSKAKNWTVNIIVTKISKLKLCDIKGQVDIIGKVKKIKL